MIIGYARTRSTEKETDLEAQRRELLVLGCERVFAEQTSAAGERKELEDALESVQHGDTLVVTKLDRLARSVPHIWEILKWLDAKGVGLRVLNMGLDTSTPEGRSILSALEAVREFEQELFLERKHEGIAKAKAAGIYKGRQPTARAKSKDIEAMAATGASIREIAIKTGVGKSSVHRILNPNAIVEKDVLQCSS